MNWWRLPLSHAPTISSVRPAVAGPPTAHRIDIGGVEEIDARRRGGIQDRVAARFVALTAEGHGAEAQPGDRKAGPAELDVLHLASLTQAAADQAFDSVKDSFRMETFFTSQ